jgi:hypothetical protein
MCSATATATSFADLVMSAFTASPTVISLPASKSNREGGVPAAFSETFMRVDGVKRPCCNSSNTTYKVIILASDAGYRASSAN